MVKTFLSQFPFHAVFRKFGKTVCWRPRLQGRRPLLRRILDPPLIRVDCVISGEGVIHDNTSVR